jgi:hypothetical protein
VETKSYTKQDLLEFIHSEQFSRLNKIPVTKHRAFSQINNPRASNDDIILVAQYDKNKLIGYLGILPDFVFYKNETISQKVGWLSCFWVEEQYRSQNYAASLFLSAFNAWGQKILITNIVPGLEPVYRKTGFFKPTKFKDGLRCYLRFNLAEMLPPKGEPFKSLTFLLRAVDGMLNILGDLRFLFKAKFRPVQIKIEYINHFDEFSERFIISHIKDNWNRRSKTELEWIIRNPWIIEGVQTDLNGSRYYFSSFSKRFFYQILKITDHQNKIKGITFICVRNNSLTVPYIFADPDCFDIIAKVLTDTMIYLKLNIITTFNKELIKTLNNISFPFLFKKKQSKTYFISKDLEPVNELDFQDGDGDCAFY